MRLIHTSDWHLGRSLHGADLGVDQQHALEQICAMVESPADGVPVDAVLVAGDVFDRGQPAVESMELLESVLVRLTAATHVILTSGNHDSARRLGFGSRLFRDRLHLATDMRHVDRPVLLTDAGGSQLAVYPFPYLEPEAARVVLADGDVQPARSHEAVVTAAMRRVHTDLASRRAETPGLRSVVMAHAFVSGGLACDSERTIAVGGVECVPAGCFEGIDYVALGHLHRPQHVAKGPAGTRLHYPGSLLRYSFEEHDQAKGVLVIDVPSEGDVIVTPAPLVPRRGMAVLRDSLHALLTAERYAEHADSWVRLEVTDQVRPERMHPQLRQRYSQALSIAHCPPAPTSEVSVATTRRSEADARELGADFIAYVTARDPLETEIELFQLAAERAARRRAAAEGA